MKNIFVISLLFLNLDIWGQCLSQKGIDSCASQLKGDVLVNTLPINIMTRKDRKANEQIFSVLLTKGTKYQFAVASSKEYDKDLTISLFDKFEHFIMSNYNEGLDKTYDKIQFDCRTTGTYLLNFEYTKKKYCGAIIVGMINKKKKK